MKVLTGQNVNELFALGVNWLAEAGVREDSRAGPVVVSPVPVMSVYERPTERVLFSKARDANPFFHFMEALWMLAGRNDAAFLDHYVKDFGRRFAEPNGEIHGAYGHRWRKAFGLDQIEEIVRRLRDNPQDRQCVLQMWDASCGHDVWGCDDLSNPHLKDRPCNTHVYLRVRKDVLDLTVCCRSNDVVWGAYGANAVHFSFLQEYLAGRIGVGIGRMYQFSNNFHGYVETLDRISDPVKLFEERDHYRNSFMTVGPSPIGAQWDAWDNDLQKFMDWHDYVWRSSDPHWNMLPDDVVNSWFCETAGNVVLSMWHHRRGDWATALQIANSVRADDWQYACTEWLLRRKPQ